MEPIRILQVVNNMNAGGIENMLMNLYRRIDRTKVQFDFLMHTSEKCIFDDEILKLGGNIYRISPIKYTKLSRHLQELDTFFKEHPYKIVHIHRSVLSYFIAKQAKKNNVPVRIAHSHEAHHSIWSHKISRVPIILALRQVVSKPLTHRFACGIDAGKWLYGKKDFTVINNAIDVLKFIYNENIAKDVRDELGIKDKIIIGHVGNFTYPKNYPFILKVFKKLVNKGTNAKLLLVGNNKNNSEVKKQIIEMGLQDKVIFTGVRSDVYRMYQAMDVFLFPSHNEGLPVTLVEAQAAGLKTFASDSITDEVAMTNDITYLSLNLSAEFWADKIIEAMPYERKNNYEAIKAKGYDIEDSALKLQEFYIAQYEANSQ